MGAELDIVREWHDAVNAGDAERLAELVHEDVEVGGPRGSARGFAVLRDWVERTGIRLQPQRAFKRGYAVVVEQRATWRSTETGAVGEPQQIASAFLVIDGVVRQLTRYDDLPTALVTSGLDEADEAHR